MGSDYVLCASCGKKQYEKDGPIGTWRGVLCQACWHEEEAKENDIPEGCQSCDGPYPNCKTSCKLIDA